MKITAPLDRPREAVPLIEAGASELYCGVLDQRWRRAGAFSNARHTFYGNLRNFGELRRVAATARARGTDLFLCLNDHYPEEMDALVREDIVRGLEAGVDGLILADPALICHARGLDSGCKIVLSSLAPCFNLQAVRFFCGLGVDRIVLPMGQLAQDEVRDLVRGSRPLGVEFEAFVTDTTCKNVGGFCSYHNLGIEAFFGERSARRQRRNMALLRAAVRLLPASAREATGKTLASLGRGASRACRDPLDISIVQATAQGIVRRPPLRAAPEGRFAACHRGLSSIFALLEAGVHAGKIPGRGSPSRRKLRDVLAVRATVDRASGKEGGP